MPPGRCTNICMLLRVSVSFLPGSHRRSRCPPLTFTAVAGICYIAILLFIVDAFTFGSSQSRSLTHSTSLIGAPAATVEVLLAEQCSTLTSFLLAKLLWARYGDSPVSMAYPASYSMLLSLCRRTPQCLCFLKS